jgi:hypothetical protein
VKLQLLIEFSRPNYFNDESKCEMKSSLCCVTQINFVVRHEIDVKLHQHKYSGGKSKQNFLWSGDDSLELRFLSEVEITSG